MHYAFFTFFYAITITFSSCSAPGDFEQNHCIQKILVFQKFQNVTMRISQVFGALNSLKMYVILRVQLGNLLEQLCY